MIGERTKPGWRVGSRRSASLVEFERLDLAWAAGTAAVGAAMFATTLTGHPGLGDAPESVAGVSSLGILHAPGYPSYVLVAHLFTLLVPFGSEAFKVNLFSLVCTALSLAGVQLLARRFGAPRWACTLGALTLGATPLLWFYSGFAKHETFSGLLFVLSVLVALAWRVRPSTGRLAVLAAVIGVGLGSSWPLELLVLPAVAFVLVAGRAELRVLSSAVFALTGLAVTAAIYGFVMIRAAQNPPVNSGGATTLSRLAELVERTDFKGVPAPPAPHGAQGPQADLPLQLAGHVGHLAAPSSGGISEHAGPIAAVHSAAALANTSGAVAAFARELSVLALLLAAGGLVASLVWRRSQASFPVLIAFLSNLVGAMLTVGFGSGNGSLDVDLTLGSDVFGCYCALACWLAVGAGELVGGLAHLSGRKRLESIRRPLIACAAVAVAAAVLVPRVIDSWPAANRSQKPYSDRYAQAAFSLLPPHAAVFVLGAELTQPLVYRQVVKHERPDVAVIAADALHLEWYRQQLQRRLHMQLPPESGNLFLALADTVKAVAAVRPVYLDPQAIEALAGLVHFRPVGLLAAVVPGHGLQPIESLHAAEARLATAVRQAGFPAHDWDVWPSIHVSNNEYATAAWIIALTSEQRGDIENARDALHEELRILPGDPFGETQLASLPH